MITPAIILMRPSALLWALAAGAVVVLYLRSIRPPTVAVARPYLWSEVLGGPRSSASTWFRRRLISAAIHIAVVLLLVLAAADPCLHRPRTVVFVMDNSRSMEAVEGGTTRLDQARTSLFEHLNGIGPREYTAIVTTAGQPVVVSPAEQNLERVRNSLERIRITDLPSHVAEAVHVGVGMAVPGTQVEVHVFSDGCFGGAVKTDRESDAVIHPVGTAEGNAAVTRLAVRRYPKDGTRFQVIVEVTNRNNVPLVAPLRVMLGGESIHQRDCEVDAQSTASVVTDLESGTGGPLVAILDSIDPLMDDNRLETTLPQATPADKHSSEAFPQSDLAEQQACVTQSPSAWVAEPTESEGYRVMPLWPWIVLSALLLLGIEWALFHRRWTC